MGICRGESGLVLDEARRHASASQWGLIVMAYIVMARGHASASQWGLIVMAYIVMARGFDGRGGAYRAPRRGLLLSGVVSLS